MRDWVERLQRRDASALLAIYDRWSRPLLALVSRITGKPEEAREVLAEVFKTFWEKSADAGFLQGSIFGILTDMARFRALDAVEARGYKNGTQAWAAFECADRFTDPSELRPWERLALPERLRRARAAMDGLDVEERALVEAAWFEGLTCTRLALRHNMPVDQMREKLTHAVRRLESALEDALA